jgi:hypothetical protein
MKRIDDVRIGKTWHIVDKRLTTTNEVDETDIVISPMEANKRLLKLQAQAEKMGIPKETIPFEVGREAFRRRTKGRTRMGKTQNQGVAGPTPQKGWRKTGKSG